MKRDLNRLANQEWDLAIIGGGIYGAALAWEAASRGLSVALVEQSDLASATSANSLKTIHGGFRYLQHADIARLRQSMMERRILMAIAPHLVHPLPVLVPTYGHGMKGREALALALLANDFLGLDRNRPAYFRHDADPQKHIPAGRTLSPQETLEKLPGLPAQGLSGGAVFWDAQVYNSERLVLAFLHSAFERGAALANYARAVGLKRAGGEVQGLFVEDQLGGERFELRARSVVNAAGPWLGQVLAGLDGHAAPALPLAKAINVVTRPLFEQYAVGLMGNRSYDDASSLLNKSSSLLFISPWRDTSMIGTTYQAYFGDPSEFRPTRQDVIGILSAINQAYPPARLGVEDVRCVHAGLLPAESGQAPGEGVRLVNHFRLLDHRQEGTANLFSVVAVKYTTARGVAARVIDRVQAALGKDPGPSFSARQPLWGGDIARFDDYLQAQVRRQPCGLSPEEIQRLVYNYGTAHTHVVDLIAGEEDRAPESEVLLQAQTRFAVREEMAYVLADVIFRRTELGTAGPPAPQDMQIVSHAMAAELGWSEEKRLAEIETVQNQLKGWMDGDHDK